jgi:hypothetical protein
MGTTPTTPPAANPQIGDSQKAPYTLTGTDAAGNPAVLETGDTVTVVSSAPASLSVVPDATPAAGSIASGFLVGGKTLATGIVVTATIAHADGTSASVTDTIDVGAEEASSLSFGLGAPVSQ